MYPPRDTRPIPRSTFSAEVITIGSRSGPDWPPITTLCRPRMTNLPENPALVGCGKRKRKATNRKCLGADLASDVGFCCCCHASFASPRLHALSFRKSPRHLATSHPRFFLLDIYIQLCKKQKKRKFAMSISLSFPNRHAALARHE